MTNVFGLSGGGCELEAKMPQEAMSWTKTAAYTKKTGITTIQCGCE